MSSRPESRARPVVLAVGGLDPCGGAGITADARAIAASGARPATVATCWTVQNRFGFRGLQAVPGSAFEAMLEAVLADAPVAAVKVGLVPDASTIDILRNVFGARGATTPLVVDPVLGATAGGLAHGGVVEPLRRLLGHATVATPNRGELAQLAPAGVEQLFDGGCRAVLVTDGDGSGATVEDELFGRDGSVRSFAHARLRRGPVHGTGCALASALAARLACGDALDEACAFAIDAVQRWLVATIASVDGRAEPLAIGESTDAT